MASQIQEIYKDIKDRILTGKYLPTSGLTETELASHYNVSRNTIKRVLLMLERENLVTVEQNKTAKIKTFTIEEVLDFLEVRERLETLIINKALPYITPKHLSSLEDFLEIMHSHLENRDLLGYSKTNKEFHNVVYQACPNRAAVDLTLNIKNQIGRYNLKTILIPGRDEESFKEHTEIYQAIKENDAQRAEELMSIHISNVRRLLKENYLLLF